MSGEVENGQLVTIVPLAMSPVVGSVVLCCITKFAPELGLMKRYYLHKVSAITEGRYQISNSKGVETGWVTLKDIFGVVQ
jgi:hypothetical protein